MKILIAHEERDTKMKKPHDGGVKGDVK